MWQGYPHAVCRRLWTGEPSVYMPWVAFGYDHPHTFEFLSTQSFNETGETLEDLEVDARRNLSDRRASWELIAVDLGDGRTLRMLSCSDDFLSAERILDRDFMRTAERRLGARGLLVGIPRRGVMLATAIDDDGRKVMAFGKATATQFAGGESAPITPILFALKDGVIVSIVEELARAEISPDELANPPPIATDESVEAGGEHEPDEDPAAPYLSIVRRRDNYGKEGVQLMAGGADAARLIRGIESEFMALLSQNATREEFNGHITIVVLAMTPQAVRKQMPRLLEHLRGICAEISKHGKPFRVSLTLQESDWGPNDSPDATAATSAIAKPPFWWWRALPAWIRVVLGLIAGLIILNSVLIEWIL